MGGTTRATDGTVGTGLAMAQGMVGTGPDTRERHTLGQCIEPTFAIVSHCFERPNKISAPTSQSEVASVGGLFHLGTTSGVSAARITRMGMGAPMKRRPNNVWLRQTFYSAEAVDLHSEARR
jgi:hypothetical protein